MTPDGPPTREAGIGEGDLAVDDVDDRVDDLEAEVPSQLPTVAVVMVAHDPGDWFEEALASLAAQDYRALVVLVVDAGSAEPIVRRVASVLPTAYVHRIENNPGWSVAANQGLAMVEGSDFFLFCHDDVALEAGTVRILVEEAFRSNAGIVGPKLVGWDAPDELRQVGLSADKTGVVSSFVQPGERDQEQHDAVRDVFCIPGGVTLVRADLARAIGGYDAAIPVLGEDLDLCWRAQVAGARVVVVPATRARHVEALDRRRVTDDRRRLLARHRLRTTLVVYSWLHLVRVLPQAALLALAEVLAAAVSGDGAHAREVAAAWPWNLRRLREVRARRKVLARLRVWPDSEVRLLQVHGSVRATAFVRGELGRARVDQLGVLRRRVSTRLSSHSLRWTLGAWATVLVVLAVGGRELWGERLPNVSALVAFGDGPTRLVADHLDGWAAAGVSGPAPTALALVGLAGMVLAGAMGLLQQLAVLGTLPLGLAGVWRLARPLDSRAARAVAVIAYGSVALPYDAVARGRWGTLVLYGASPWILARLARSTGEVPFAPAERSRRRGARRPGRVRSIVALGLVTAVAAAFVPLVVLIVPVMGLALSLGSRLGDPDTDQPSVTAVTGLSLGDLVDAGPEAAAPPDLDAPQAVLAGAPAGGRRRSRRWGPLVTGLGAALVAVVLLAPWSATLVEGPGWWRLVGVASPVAVDTDLGALLRFDTGPTAIGVFGFGVPLAALLALIIGHGWRFRWAVRLWLVALAGWAAAAAAGEGWLGDAPPDATLFLAPVAAALALAVGLGVVAFEDDLRRAHFGWRQLVSVAAAGAMVLATLPALGATVDGRWYLPSADSSPTLAFFDRDDRAAEGDYRVLWVGAAWVLPLAGVPLAGELAVAVAEASEPSLDERWSPGDDSTAQAATAVVRVTADGETQRSGARLADLGVRYVVLARRSAPTDDAEQAPLPEALLTNFDQQLDLRPMAVDPGLVVYENLAWRPVEESPGSDGGLGLGLAAQAGAWALALAVVAGGGRRTRRATRRGRP